MYKSFACSLFFVLQAYNEVQRCFLTVGLVYPEDLFTFLLNVRHILFDRYGSRFSLLMHCETMEIPSNFITLKNYSLACFYVIRYTGYLC